MNIVSISLGIHKYTPPKGTGRQFKMAIESDDIFEEIKDLKTAVLNSITKDITAREIADTLGAKIGAVNTHLGDLRRKGLIARYQVGKHRPIVYWHKVEKPNELTFFSSVV